MSSAAEAQRWGQGPQPREGACFYKDSDFHGEYFCAGVGDTFASVPGDMNDKISSIRVFGRVEVTVYRDVQFNGGSSKFGGSIKNLKDEGWNDRISSLRVRNYANGGGQDPDRIVRRAYQEVLHRDPDAGGLQQYRRRIIDDGWTESEVRESLRSSPEYRELTTMTPAKAQDIVRQAYLRVLKREPDSGAAGFVNRVMTDHWTQEDVERELRKSPEYREKRR
jgi:hypothetical protein